MSRAQDFKKRHFRSFNQIFSEAGYLIRARSQIRAVMRSGAISPEFRERLMLAVTEVNQCRYCSYAHTRMALKSGLSSGEIRMILSHDLQACPEQEITAVLYAQHWAETDGHPAAEVRQSLENQYGGDQAARIDLILRLMRAANLLGNTFDLVLFRISFGAWGR